MSFAKVLKSDGNYFSKNILVFLKYNNPWRLEVMNSSLEPRVLIYEHICFLLKQTSRQPLKEKGYNGLPVARIIVIAFQTLKDLIFFSGSVCSLTHKLICSRHYWEILSTKYSFLDTVQIVGENFEPCVSTH